MNKSNIKSNSLGGLDIGGKGLSEEQLYQPALAHDTGA